jgi:hypothetical protein
MKLKNAFMMILTATAIGLLIGHAWNLHTRSKMPRMMTLEMMEYNV